MTNRRKVWIFLAICVVAPHAGRAQTARITSIEPVNGHVGDTLIVRGIGFGRSPAVALRSSVSLELKKFYSTDTLIKIILTASDLAAAPDRTRVFIRRTPEVVSTQLFFPVPRITGFTDEVPIGKTVTITGDALNHVANVRFTSGDGSPASGLQPRLINTSALNVVVPPNAADGPITLAYYAGVVTSAQVFKVGSFGRVADKEKQIGAPPPRNPTSSTQDTASMTHVDRTPTITSVSPLAGHNGDTIFIRGTHFIRPSVAFSAKPAPDIPVSSRVVSDSVIMVILHTDALSAIRNTAFVQVKTAYGTVLSVGKFSPTAHIVSVTSTAQAGEKISIKGEQLGLGKQAEFVSSDSRPAISSIQGTNIEMFARVPANAATGPVSLRMKNNAVTSSNDVLTIGSLRRAPAKDRTIGAAPGAGGAPPAAPVNEESDTATAPAPIDLSAVISQVGDLAVFAIIAPSIEILGENTPDARCRGLRDMKRRLHAAVADKQISEKTSNAVFVKIKEGLNGSKCE